MNRDEMREQIAADVPDVWRPYLPDVRRDLETALESPMRNVSTAIQRILEIHVPNLIAVAEHAAITIKRAEQAEAAIERVRTTVAALRQMSVAALDDGDTGLSDDHYAGVERAADSVAAALDRAPAEESPLPPGAPGVPSPVGEAPTPGQVAADPEERTTGRPPARASICTTKDCGHDRVFHDLARDNRTRTKCLNIDGTSGPCPCTKFTPQKESP